VVVRACHFSCGGNHKMEGWWYTLAPGKKWDPISKIANTKRAEGLARVVECLTRKYKALSSNPSTVKTLVDKYAFSTYTPRLNDEKDIRKWGFWRSGCVWPTHCGVVPVAFLPIFVHLFPKIIEVGVSFHHKILYI
jgi:hypothetical protein